MYDCQIGERTGFDCECEHFEGAYTRESIEEELLSDIRDPAICGAKEPKIAALLWVLHEDDAGIVNNVRRMLTGG